MQPWSRRVKLEIYSTLNNEDVHKLTKFYHAKLGPALEIFTKDSKESSIYFKIFVFNLKHIVISY